MSKNSQYRVSDNGKKNWKRKWDSCLSDTGPLQEAQNVEYKRFGF